MSWMLAVAPSQVLPLRSALGRGAAVACDECGTVFVRRTDGRVVFPTTSDAIAAATTFCEGWSYVIGNGRDHLVCVDCVATREAAGEI
ncbi:hypothetical protein [Janibacter terrae]|uniref:hypothetical protein n=1 Tax=Janibacter terrae TaxID=103817 RepID=UPI0008380486|nr:hypothetical protein [Janibacter terrae]